MATPSSGHGTLRSILMQPSIRGRPDDCCRPVNLSLLRHRRIQRQLNHDCPAAIGIAVHVPMRLHAHGLMDQLEATFRLADGFNRTRPDVRRPIEFQAGIDAQPLIAQVQVSDVG